MTKVRTQVTEIGFAPKEIIPQEVCRLEVMAADKADTCEGHNYQCQCNGGCQHQCQHGSAPP